MFIELLQHLLSNIQILLLKENPSEETRTADPITTTLTTTTAVTTTTPNTTTNTNTATSSTIHSTESTTHTSAVDEQEQVTLPLQHRINLAQSAMMCIDIITKHYKQLSIKLKYHYKYIQDKYELTFFEILKDLTNITLLLSDLITGSTSKVSSKSTLASTTVTTGSSIQLHDDIIALQQQQQGHGASKNQGSGEVEVVAKILGSSFLVVGSLCSVLSGRCLPLLAVCLKIILYTCTVYASMYIIHILIHFVFNSIMLSTRVYASYSNLTPSYR